MPEFLEETFDLFTTFDLIYVIITVLTVIQCSRKGFVLSLFSASKWLLAIIITIIMVPKLKPWASEYIESNYIADISLGVSIFIISIFTILIVNKGISKVVRYSGFGSLDSFFGFIFGFFKGYIVCVVLFSLINWFYSYDSWPFETKKSFTFNYVYKGSNYLIKEFPNEEKYIDSKEKIKDI